ncbi:hypothetical protein ZHAS_00001184 [Anopheles sinensis]|uniref:Uncharacterized protein n=1 Tax=Anopheles sinensis TaxID=74873 RepID=A0A084VB44_ANOSI|nr:hypothetical protein ZHAS_00001184 [Anopheles sinensis]
MSFSGTASNCVEFSERRRIITGGVEKCPPASRRLVITERAVSCHRMSTVRSKRLKISGRECFHERDADASAEVE